MPDMYTLYQTDGEDGLIDPPIIPDMERQLIEAGALGDTVQIEILTEEYAAKRQKVADLHNEKVNDRATQDKMLLAERGERARVAAQEKADADAEARRRADLDQLRANEAENPSPSAAAQDPAMGTGLVPNPPSDADQIAALQSQVQALMARMGPVPPSPPPDNATGGNAEIGGSTATIDNPAGQFTPPTTTTVPHPAGGENQ